ncbi:MAG: sugar transferase [Muribaculaceae bacterium]|nr:sugar transferase [Muribaculaceae bacterium]
MLSKKRQRIKYIVADLVTANIGILLFDILRFNSLPTKATGFNTLHAFLSSNVLVYEQIFIPLMLMCLYWLSGYYNEPFQRRRLQEFFTTALTQIAGTLLVYFALLTNQATSVRATNILLLLGLYTILVVVTYIGRWLVTARMMHAFRAGLKKYNVLVAGSPDSAVPTGLKIKQYSDNTGMHFAGYICTHGHKQNFPDNEKVYTCEEIIEKYRQLDIQEIILTSPHPDERETLHLINMFIPLEIPIKILSESISILNSNIRLQSIYEEPYIDASSANVSEATKNIKRVFDVVISSLALLFLAIPMGVIAMLVKRSSPGPVLFTQERIGYRRRPFKIYKFRSMRTDAEADGPQLSNENDPRVTPLGVTLRKYRLDELPQFWNVFKGDMSLVGPRPERPYFIKRIMEYDPAYTLVHLVRPGITSWGMVKYGYASHVDEMVRRLRYDLIYISNISLSVDIKILIYTIKTVIKGRGV